MKDFVRCGYDSILLRVQHLLSCVLLVFHLDSSLASLTSTWKGCFKFGF